MPERINIQYPLFIPFIAYLSGIGTDALLLTRPIVYWIAVVPVLLITSICTLHTVSNSLYTRRFLVGIALVMFFHIIGAINHQFFRLAHLKPEVNHEYKFIRVNQPVQRRQNSIQLHGTHLHSARRTSMGKVLLYLQKSQRALELSPGDIILIKSKSHVWSSPINPGEFNYVKYLNTNGIKGYEYIPSESWKLWRNERLFSIINLALKVKSHLASEIDSWPVSSDTRSLAKALLLGERKSFETRQLEAYAAAGAMHILAVSGLHTGIFYLVLSFLFRPLRNWKYGKAVSSLIILILLWCYAFITGLSASVVRSVCMCSLLALGNSISRTTKVHNTILASGFILLLVWPGYLFQVGFQLSYAAILGIVSIQPFLTHYLTSKYWLLKKTWGLISVSIAAQASTLPLALFHFHQFPSLFIVTNLLVIPMVSLIMYLGLLCFLISTLPLTTVLHFKVFDLLVTIMNQGVNGIESLGVHLTGIYLPLLAGLGVYLLIFFAFRWWIYGKFQNLLRSVILVLLIIMLGSLRWIGLNQTELIAYHFPDSPVLGIFRNDQAVIISNSSLASDSIAIRHKLSGHWLKRSVLNPAILDINKDTTCHYFLKHGPLIFSADRFLLLYGEPINFIPAADTWMVTKSLSPPDLSKNFPELVVLTSVVNNYHNQEWQIWCIDNNIEFWDINRQGAWSTKTSNL